MIEQSTHQFINIASQQDFGALEQLLADDVVLHSPTMAQPVANKEFALKAISTAIALLHQGEFEANKQFIGDAAAMIDFQSTINGEYLNVADQFTINEQGKIIEFKVFLRPVGAATMFCEEMLKRLHP